MIPEEPERLNVADDQIIAKILNVIYHGMSWRVEISKADAKNISDSVEKLTRDFYTN